MTGAPAVRPGVLARAERAAITEPVAPSGRVMERGRSKAYRPLPPEVRAEAVDRGLAAYGRGAWYLAHEELEPAWMGTDDPGERAILSGIIKLAAAHVHAARGNPLGVRTNLRGARERLAAAAEMAGPATTGSIDAAGLTTPDMADSADAAGPTSARAGAVGALKVAAWIDLPMLLTGVDDRLARIEAICAGPAIAVVADAGATVPSHDVAGPVGRFHGARVAIPDLPLPRRPA